MTATVCGQLIQSALRRVQVDDSFEDKTVSHLLCCPEMTSVPIEKRHIEQQRGDNYQSKPPSPPITIQPHDFHRNQRVY